MKGVNKMSKITIYAKTLNPEDFDYRMYDISEDDYNEVFILGGRDYCDIDNKGYLSDIKKLINDYNGWSYYGYNNWSNYFNDMLPNKENGKALSPKEVHNIMLALDENDKNKIICLCLSIITGKQYRHKGPRGCCQGDYVDAYYPNTVSQAYIDFVEAWFFGTGTEVIIHDCDNIPQSAMDIEGFSFYTATYGIDNLKREIKRECGYKDDDEVDVKLWLYDKSTYTRQDIYKEAV